MLRAVWSGEHQSNSLEYRNAASAHRPVRCSLLLSPVFACLYRRLSLPLQVLAQNSGYDPQETLVKLQTEYKESGQLIGVDLSTGELG